MIDEKADNLFGRTIKQTQPQHVFNNLSIVFGRANQLITCLPSLELAYNEFRFRDSLLNCFKENIKIESC